MRHVLASAFVVALLCAASSAQAERRMFIINGADGYGIDRCLAGGEKCGQAAAQAYCKTHEFAEAASFNKIDRDDITGSIPASTPGACHGAKCDEFVAIVCTR